jgi:hypothetical protein
MAMVSHLHHLFNPETCQNYIHTLRWKDRPLQCPRCQSHNVGPWGTFEPAARLRDTRSGWWRIVEPKEGDGVTTIADIEEEMPDSIGFRGKMVSY